MKTIKMIIECDVYNHRVEVSHQFDSDVTSDEIQEILEPELMLKACLLGVGYYGGEE